VRTDSWGELVEDVAKQLGVNKKSGVMRARWAGVFSERPVKGLGGRHGRHPVPLIHSWDALDPSGPMFRKPEQLWVSVWEWLADRLPDDFEQMVVRRPIWKKKRGEKSELRSQNSEAGEYTRPLTPSLSPEYRGEGEGSDYGGEGEESERKGEREEKEYGGERVNIEHSTSNVQRPTNSPPNPGEQEEAYGENRKDANGDEMQFWGWSWVCPACKKTVKKIYYPIAPRTIFDFLGFDPARSKRWRTPSKRFMPYDVHDMPTLPGTFACASCHEVVSTTRTRPTAWNEVVSWFSGGMLYGHEVEKPHWYRAERKVARHRKLGNPAVKREAVFTRLRLGWPVEQIALNMQISKKAVEHSVRRICEQERVKNRAELAGKLGWTHSQPLNGRERIRQVGKERERLVEGLLMEGLGYKEIAKRLNLRANNVQEAAVRIYRKHGMVIVRKRARKDFMQRFGVAEKVSE
jgi:DNA-binding CsgD family transcriptional regulator